MTAFKAWVLLGLIMYIVDYKSMRHELEEADIEILPGFYVMMPLMMCLLWPLYLEKRFREEGWY